MKKLTATELQKIFDAAKFEWTSTANLDVEANLYPTYCTIIAFCKWANIPAPTIEERNWLSRAIED